MPKGEGYNPEPRTRLREGVRRQVSKKINPNTFQKSVRSGGVGHICKGREVEDTKVGKVRVSTDLKEAQNSTNKTSKTNRVNPWGVRVSWKRISTSCENNEVVVTERKLRHRKKGSWTTWSQHEEGGVGDSLI